MSRGVAWVFRISNPEKDDCPKDWPSVQYCIWQKERGAGGLIHLQGYVIFASVKGLGALKRIHAGAHWEKRMGSHLQAKAYSSKEDTRIAGPWEEGQEPVGQGARTDLKDFKEAMDRGSTMSDLMESHFTVMMKYSRFAREYMLYTRPRERDWITFTTVFWGPPGSGKTSRARREAGKGAFWMMKPGPGQTAFFDGYEGQENVIIDEFYGWIPRDLMCRLCDRHPVTVQTKGGAVSFFPKRIWITSNEHPMKWYPKVGLGPMERRLSGEFGKIEYVQGNVTEPLPEGAALDDRLELPGLREAVLVTAAGEKRRGDEMAARQARHKKKLIEDRLRAEAEFIDCDATQQYDSDVDECAPSYARQQAQHY